MKKMSILLAVCFIAATTLIAMADNGPAVIKLKASMGVVTFAHANHQSKIAECTECHHNGTETPKCTGCHGVKDGVPSAKKALHKDCRGCHKKSGGPTKCKECHKK